MRTFNDSARKTRIVAADITTPVAANAITKPVDEPDANLATPSVPTRSMNNVEKISRSLEWARAQGKLGESDLPAETITDGEVEHLMAERAAAKKARNFSRADAIRTQLSEAGIAVEDTKDGIRWKRK